MTRLRGWWAARTLRLRITLVVAGVALVMLLVLSRVGVGLLAGAMLGSADVELRADAVAAAGHLTAGTDPGLVRSPTLRVLDTAGTPVDGGRPLPLQDGEVRALAAGEGVISGRYDELRRYLAEPVVVPDGSTRLVVAVGDIVGGAVLLARAAGAFVLGALVAAAVLAAAAWLATRAALRPVERLRTAAAALPPGERLPVPPARDELRALAEEFNDLLARRDEAVTRMQAFTGDAAHELRSPVAAIRAQAEVAVAHPDPELAEETLRSVAVEAERLSALLSDLLALARADSGRRTDPRPVDLVGAARTAIDRLGIDRLGIDRLGTDRLGIDRLGTDRLGTDRSGTDRSGTDRAGREPVLHLVAPAPALVAAGAAEVDLVLDNLIGNARRYARSVVRIGVLPAGRWTRLVVEDDGPGIPAADRQRVFDRFVRLAPEAAPDSGAGLGLALVAALVHGRGGQVAAGESADGGARLEVRWPTATP